MIYFQFPKAFSEVVSVGIRPKTAKKTTKKDPRIFILEP
jgi:hypothetical protein